MNDSLTIKKGLEAELKIESLVYGGMGLAKIDNFVIFVKNAIPGQIVKAFIYKKKKGYAEGRPLEVVEESPYINDVSCEHFMFCGGCSFQNMV